MGCTQGRFVNDQTCRVFRVFNVDDQGNKLSPGKLEVGEADLTLHQAGKDPICWPLRCLRRYGFDSDLFSFESGRRCPTGQGIYAFSCRNAEDLFNLVQEAIKNEQNRANHNFVAASSATRRAMSRPTSHIEARSNSGDAMPDDCLNSENLQENALENHTYVNTDINCSSKQHSYINTELTSDVNRSQNAILIDFLENPENLQNPTESQVPQSLLDLNTDQLTLSLLGYSQVTCVRPVSFNRDIEAQPVVNNSPKAESPYVNSEQFESHKYKTILDERLEYTSNVNGGKGISQNDEEKIHEYANISLTADKALSVPKRSCPPIQMNYAQLELNKSSDNLYGGFVIAQSQMASVAAISILESPRNDSSGYAQIDFDKTMALETSNIFHNDPDDGVRKTRHNSTINDI